MPDFEHDGLRNTADFACGSAGTMERAADENVYVVHPKPEPVPDWFFEALQANFAGAGVPREYAFNVGVTSDRERSVRLRFAFTKTNGSSYMDPPYWVLRDGRWWQVPDDDVSFEPGEWGEVTVMLAEEETVYIANKPYVTPDRVEREIDELAATFDFLSAQVIGRTIEGRAILALETETRDEKILVNATMQPAEPAARPVLSVAHWLTDRSDLTTRLLDRFQFCFVPMPNPDGSFHGRSVTNAVGEVPMFSFGRYLEGEDAPAETASLWQYAENMRPTGHIEFHTHYQDTRFHKLNPLSLDWFSDSLHDRVRETNHNLLGLNPDWRVTPIEPTTPLCKAGKFANLAERFQTISYCYQIYCLSEEATCAQAVSAVSALAQGLAGTTWRNQLRTPRIVRG